MKKSQKYTISIVIPALNEEHSLAKCIETILQFRTPELKEIIVVDNGSSDNTVKVAKRYPLVKVLRFSKPLGLPGAREPGFDIAKGDLIASLDADVMISAEWFHRVQELFSRHPSVICVSGPYHYYDFGPLENIAHRVLSATVSFPFYWMTGYRIIGGNFVLRRKAIQNVDIFDNGVRFWGEDSTIGNAVIRFGKMLYTEKLFVYTSARRWKREGFFRLGWKYLENLLSEGILKHPYSTKKAAVVR